MKPPAILEHALRQASLSGGIASIRNLSGGCIHQVLEITLDDGQRVVAKTNNREAKRLFEEEAHGLRALDASKTVLTPQPLTVAADDSSAILLLSFVEPGAAASSAWRRLGADLAALHAADAGARYGFDIDNHIGSTLQPNFWHDDWVEFNAVNRLGFQLDTAMRNHLMTGDEAAMIQSVIERLDQFLPRHPKPALLHGDLWSGNALATSGDRIALIDPACSVGDGWADIAMMKLFGGFPAECFDSYRGAVSGDDQVEDRIVVYQLYHVMNHINIFGRGYVSQAMALAKSLGAWKRA